MNLYRIERMQRLPVSLNEAWTFFSSPKNLATITPDHMGFEIRSGLSEQMYAGQMIVYTVRPLLGIPLTWVTEITHVDLGSYFVDEQRFGPYALWHHTHSFVEVEGGVECTDLVHYKLPFGFLGRIIHRLGVRNQLESIFDYREKKLIEIFGEYDTDLFENVKENNLNEHLTQAIDCNDTDQ